MREWLQGIWLAIVWGVVSGALSGCLAVAADGYASLGLYRSALRGLLGGIWPYAGLALLGGVVAGPLWLLGSAVARRLDLPVEPHRRLFVAASVSLPVWVGLALHDRWLLPRGFAASLATLSIGVVLHAGILVVGHRFVPAGGASWDARIRAAAAVLVVVVLGLAGVQRLWPGASSGERPDLLLVVLDTVRADRLSSYGYPRPTTPEIDAFAKDAIRFTDFYSTSSWTLPSHASLFTGLYPSAHGATEALSRGHTTLAELLREEGFQTWGASANPLVGARTHLSQGFDGFVRTWSTGHGVQSRPGRHPAVSGFESFLGGADRGRPFFAFVNLMEAHSPYVPPPDLQRRFLKRPVGIIEIGRVVRKEWMAQYSEAPFSERELAVLSDLYDGSVAHASRVFGQLLDVLRRDGRFDRTWIVVTSDHGEHFGENGRVAHMYTLYNTAVRVPLVVRPPGGTGGPRSDDRPGQLVDLFPALLAALGVERPAPPRHGRDLLAPDFRREQIFSEYEYAKHEVELIPAADRERNRDRLDPHRRALQRDGARFIWSSDGRHELYDLSRDPGETRNLYDPDAPTPLAQEMLAAVERLAAEYGAAATHGRDTPDALDEDTEDALRALGYAR